MRILVFHGYLLSGTGSNVYNARLAEALVRLGHEVHLLCQDRHPERQRFVDAAGDWDGGELRVRTLREPVRCTVYRPDIGTLLPVYVADRYEGIEARTFLQTSDAEVARYVEANVEAVRALRERVRPDLALANHLVMGPVILARALRGDAGADVPYAVKIHGSALEYTVKAAPERFLAPAREGLLAARAILVGSSHTAQSLWQALGEEEVVRRTRLGPPGVDVSRFRPLEEHRAELQPARPDAAREALSAGLLGRLVQTLRAQGHERPAAGGTGTSAFARDAVAAARALEGLDPARERLVAFVGKLIVNKGVDLLLAAWPLVLARVPEATLVIVGFGSYRATLERLLHALSDGDLEEVRLIAELGVALEEPAASAGDSDRPRTGAAGRARGSEPEGPPGAANAQPLGYLLAFLDGLQGVAREQYLAAAAHLPERSTFTGRLEHEELATLLPACEAVVVPSTFPESFGMIAVEAAACGALPVSAAHSGLEEVSAVLARALQPPVARWLSFSLGERAVPALAECVAGWLQAEERVRAETRNALVSAVRERFSWEGVARGVIAAASGELERLEAPRAGGGFG
jgi:glycosyltransferase involved in cell wall biosynthesis